MGGKKKSKQFRKSRSANNSICKTDDQVTAYAPSLSANVTVEADQSIGPNAEIISGVVAMETGENANKKEACGEEVAAPNASLGILVEDTDPGLTVIIKPIKVNLTALKCNAWIKALSSIMDPVFRHYVELDIKSVDELYQHTSLHSQVSITADGIANMKLNRTSQLFVAKLLPIYRTACRRIFCIWAAYRGYSADSFIDDDFDDFYPIVKKLNVQHELDLLMAISPAISTIVGLSSVDGCEILEEAETIRRLIGMIENKETEKLAEEGVIYKLSDPVERLKLNLEVTDDELHTIISDSVNSSFGSFVWLASNNPERMFTKRNVVCILEKIQSIAAGTDARRWHAFYTMLPPAIAALSPEEQSELAEQFIEDPATKLKKWSYLLDEGCSFALSLAGKDAGPVAGRAKLALHTQMMDAETKEQFSPFALLLCLISTWDAKSAGVEDTLFKALARLLIGEPRSSPLEKRKLVLDALVSLPSSISDRLLALNDHPVTSSLYNTADVLLCEVKQMSVFKGAGCCALKLLADVLSPVRLLSDVILPKLSSSDQRKRAAVAVTCLLSLDKLKQELLQTDCPVTPAMLLKAALDQYEQPSDLSTDLGRYQFMASIFSFVNSTLSTENVPDAMVEGVRQIFNERVPQLSWNEYFSISRLFFRSSLHRLDPVMVPDVDSINRPDVSITSIQSVGVASVLLAWPLLVDSEMNTFALLEQFVEEFSPNVDKVVLSCHLLSLVCDSSNSLKIYLRDVEKLILKWQRQMEVTSSEAEMTRKTENGESADEKGQEEVGKRAIDEEGTGGVDTVDEREATEPDASPAEPVVSVDSKKENVVLESAEENKKVEEKGEAEETIEKKDDAVVAAVREEEDVSWLEIAAHRNCPRGARAALLSLASRSANLAIRQLAGSIVARLEAPPTSPIVTALPKAKTGPVTSSTNDSEDSDWGNESDPLPLANQRETSKGKIGQSKTDYLASMYRKILAHHHNGLSADEGDTILEIPLWFSEGVVQQHLIGPPSTGLRSQIEKETECVVAICNRRPRVEPLANNNQASGSFGTRGGFGAARGGTSGFIQYPKRPREGPSYAVIRWSDPDDTNDVQLKLAKQARAKDWMQEVISAYQERSDSRRMSHSLAVSHPQSIDGANAPSQDEPLEGGGESEQKVEGAEKETTEKQREDSTGGAKEMVETQKKEKADGVDEEGKGKTSSRGERNKNYRSNLSKEESLKLSKETKASFTPVPSHRSDVRVDLPPWMTKHLYDVFLGINAMRYLKELDVFVLMNWEEGKDGKVSSRKPTHVVIRSYYYDQKDFDTTDKQRALQRAADVVRRSLSEMESRRSKKDPEESAKPKQNSKNNKKKGNNGERRVDGKQPEATAGGDASRNDTLA